VNSISWRLGVARKLDQKRSLRNGEEANTSTDPVFSRMKPGFLAQDGRTKLRCGFFDVPRRMIWFFDVPRFLNHHDLKQYY
jgi:hypothetical protein